MRSIQEWGCADVDSAGGGAESTSLLSAVPRRAAGGRASGRAFMLLRPPDAALLAQADGTADASGTNRSCVSGPDSELPLDCQLQHRYGSHGSRGRRRAWHPSRRGGRLLHRGCGRAGAGDASGVRAPTPQTDRLLRASGTLGHHRDCSAPPAVVTADAGHRRNGADRIGAGPQGGGPGHARAGLRSIRNQLCRSAGADIG